MDQTFSITRGAAIDNDHELQTIHRCFNFAYRANVFIGSWGIHVWWTPVEWA